VVTTAPLVHEPSSSVLLSPAKKAQPNVDPIVLAVLAMLPGWCVNRDMKVKGALEKIQREMPRFVDLMSHLMEMVTRFHAYLTVGEALELLERHTSQCSRDIDVQELMSKVKPAKLPKPMVTPATRKAQESQDGDLLQHVLGMMSKVSHDWKVGKVLKVAQKQSPYSIDLVTHIMRIMPKLRGDAMVSEAMDLMARRLSEIIAKTGHAPRQESAATGKGPVAVETKVFRTEQNSTAVLVTKTVDISKDDLSPQADSNSMDEPVAATEDAFNNPCVSKATIYSKENTVAEANVASKTIFSEKSIAKATKEPPRPKSMTVAPPVSASIAPKHPSVTETAALINRSSNKPFLQEKQAVPTKDESTNQAVDDDTAVS
jgi:hypothetical protein